MMEAPPAVITTDSEWYSEYIKHTDNPEIQELELQLRAASAGPLISQKSGSTEQCASDNKNASMSPIKKHQLITEVGVTIHLAANTAI